MRRHTMAEIINYRALATGALGFTVALAWNAATADLLHGVVPEKAAALLRAVIITGVVFLIALLANRGAPPAESFRDPAELVRLPRPGGTAVSRQRVKNNQELS